MSFEDFDQEQYELALAQERAQLDLAIFDWNPDLHPRNLLGKFRDTLAGMHEGQRANLPDGTYVERGPSGFVVNSAGETHKVDDINAVAEIADHALDKSTATPYKSKAATFFRKLGPVLDDLAAVTSPRYNQARTKKAITEAALDGGIRIAAGGSAWDEVEGFLKGYYEARGKQAKTKLKRDIANWMLRQVPKGLGRVKSGGTLTAADESGSAVGLDLSLPIDTDIYERELVLATALPAVRSSGSSSGPGHLVGGTTRVAGVRRRSGTHRQQAILRAERRADASSSSGFDESQHPRGAEGSPEGGQFVRKGDSGAAVQRIQAELGMDNISGTYGHKTKQAVKEYQRKNGLQVDGVVGSQTAASILGQGSKDPGSLTDHQVTALASTGALRRATAKYGRSRGRRKARRHGGDTASVA